MAMKHKLPAAAIVMALTAASPLVIVAQPASAFPAGHSIFGFNYKVTATAFVKRAGISLTPPPGVFKGAIDLDTGQLKGTIKIPDSSFAQGIVPGLSAVALSATASMVQVKPVTGHVNLDNYKVTATSVFNIRIRTMYADMALPALPKIPVIGGLLPIGSLPPLIPRVNLVGNGCTTEHPVSVTMSGIAKIGQKSTFKGTFTIPEFTNCQAMTALINQEVPGPGNTFSATAEPVE